MWVLVGGFGFGIVSFLGYVRWEVDCLFSWEKLACLMYECFEIEMGSRDVDFRERIDVFDCFVNMKNWGIGEMVNRLRGV